MTDGVGYLWRAAPSTGKLVMSVLDACGGRRTEGDDWDIYWDGGISPDEVFARLDGKRRAGGFKGLWWLCTKHGLAMSLERARELAARRVADDLFDFAPRSFVFPRDYHAWRVRAAEEPDTVWISKVGDSGEGKGVNVVTDVDAVRPERDLVLQEYVATPHLLDGHKYTLRVFVAITSLDPLRVWVFPDGLTKLTTRPFTMDPASLGNRFVHLTNRSVLRDDVGVDLDSKFMTHRQYRARLRREGVDDTPIFEGIRALTAKSVLAAREQIIQAQSAAGLPLDGCFTVVGLDVLIDRGMRPWLIEANMRVSLSGKYSGGESARAELEIKRRVTTDFLALLGLHSGEPVLFEPVFPSMSMFEWLPAYEEVRGSDVTDLRAACAEARVDPRVALDDVAVERDTPEELVVVHARHRHRLELNATAALIWRSFARGLPASEVVRAVAREDGPESALGDVWDALAQFLHLGVWTLGKEP